MKKLNLKLIGLLAAAGTAFGASSNTQAGIVNLSMELTDNEAISQIMEQQLAILKEIYAAADEGINGGKQDSNAASPCEEYDATGDTTGPSRTPLTYLRVDDPSNAGEFQKGQLGFVQGTGSKATTRLYDFGQGASGEAAVLDRYNDIQLSKCFVATFTFHKLTTTTRFGAADTTLVNPDGALPQRLAEKTAIYETVLNKAGMPGSLEFVLGYATHQNTIAPKVLGTAEVWVNSGIPADMVTETTMDGNADVVTALNTVNILNTAAVGENAEPLWYCADATQSGISTTIPIAAGAAGTSPLTEIYVTGCVRS